MQPFLCCFVYDERRDTEQAMLAMCRHDSQNICAGIFYRVTIRKGEANKVYWPTCLGSVHADTCFAMVSLVPTTVAVGMDFYCAISPFLICLLKFGTYHYALGQLSLSPSAMQKCRIAVIYLICKNYL